MRVILDNLGKKFDFVLRHKNIFLLGTFIFIPTKVKKCMIGFAIYRIIKHSHVDTLLNYEQS